MAAGDVTPFNNVPIDALTEAHDWSSADTLKIGLITSAQTPTANDATPAWGDYSSNEVSTGSSYTGPITLSSVSLSRSSAVTTLDAANVSITQDASSGFTDARWGIVYNDSAASDEAVCFVDLGSNRSIQSGPLNINWHASGMVTFTRT